MNVIPKPQYYKKEAGFFIINRKTRVNVKPEIDESKTIAKRFISTINAFSSFTIELASGNREDENIISLKIDQSITEPESYKLAITSREIVLKAKEGAGLFYGMQTLFQLLPPEIESNSFQASAWKIPCCQIVDFPRFAYRGMHLDVSRHFFPIEFIKKYIDYIAMHKMNKFHWHLTDDNGWRLEIKQYPKLQEISAWRVDREELDWRERSPAKPGEKATYGGYYTQDEVKEIVQYAEERFVTVIPEIEMPGHSIEVLAAYPQLGCFGKKLTVPTGSYWPNEDIFCAGNEKVFDFLKNVLDEVVELFPSAYIHIGGDEASKTNWKKCPKCQKRIKQENLKDEFELQSWFIKRIEKYLISKGRKIIGWDEILEGGLAPGATVMSWRGIEGGINAAKRGHDVIMTPGTHCYFDHYQGDPKTEPKAIGGFTNTEKVYSYEPIPEELDAKQSKHVLGAQANLWTEWVQTPEHAEYMILPRMSALSEVVWSNPQNKNWNNFKQRILALFKRFQFMNANYCNIKKS